MKSRNLEFLRYEQDGFLDKIYSLVHLPSPKNWLVERSTSL